MCQKLCYRKWVNEVSDLETCTEKLQYNEKKCDPRHYGFGCFGDGGAILMHHHGPYNYIRLTLQTTDPNNTDSTNYSTYI